MMGTILGMLFGKNLVSHHCNTEKDEKTFCDGFFAFVILLFFFKED